jgi:hypothetical protein
MGSGRRASEVFAGLEILEDLEILSARFRSPYARILPRNHFILIKKRAFGATEHDFGYPARF